MRRRLLGFMLPFLVSALTTPALAADEGGATYGSGRHAFSLATGSPGELGLLQLLAEDFARRADARMAWVKAGIVPVGDWYIVTKDFMTASLKRANAEGAYFMSDSSTWLMEKGVAPDLTILYRGDKFGEGLYNDAAYAAKYDR